MVQELRKAIRAVSDLHHNSWEALEGGHKDLRPDPAAVSPMSAPQRWWECCGPLKRAPRGREGSKGGLGGSAAEQAEGRASQLLGERWPSRQGSHRSAAQPDSVGMALMGAAGGRRSRDGPASGDGAGGLADGLSQQQPGGCTSRTAVLDPGQEAAAEEERRRAAVAERVKAAQAGCEAAHGAFAKAVRSVEDSLPLTLHEVYMGEWL